MLLKTQLSDSYMKKHLLEQHAYLCLSQKKEVTYFINCLDAQYYVRYCGETET